MSGRNPQKPVEDASVNLKRKQISALENLDGTDTGTDIDASVEDIDKKGSACVDYRNASKTIDLYGDVTEGGSSYLELLVTICPI